MHYGKIKYLIFSLFFFLGKTAAFMLPILERLLYKPKSAPMTRVLIITPTRELGVQIHNVTKQLSTYMKIEVGLAIGKDIVFCSFTKSESLLNRLGLCNSLCFC